MEKKDTDTPTTTTGPESMIARPVVYEPMQEILRLCDFTDEMWDGGAS
jgi:hypothetical protein